MHFEQSVPLSFAFAFLSGFLNVAATASLAYPYSKNEEAAAAARGEVWSKSYLRLACVANIVLQLSSSGSSTVSAFFGPVSLVRPTATASQLVSNMVVFSFLRLEFFPKDKQVGTLIVLAGALSLLVNGPGVQNNQDTIELVTQPIALVWSIVLMMGTYGSTLYMALRGLKSLPQTWKTVLLLCAQVGSGVIATTVAKMIVLVQTQYLVPLFVLWLSMGPIIIYATVLQSTAVSQSSFVPLMVAMDIVTNAVTGIIVWEDWRVVDSWLGYGCVFLQLGLGNYLLSSLDLWSSQAEASEKPQISKRTSTLIRHSSLFSDPKESLILFTMMKGEEETASNQGDDRPVQGLGGKMLDLKAVDEIADQDLDVEQGTNLSKSSVEDKRDSVSGNDAQPMEEEARTI